ncbi:putative disease resistance RPP13-like protein 1 [Prunus avium]|uniref:Disease resistance RPP13-like protein 1 n=1 Tax=Prunus avium TaxID=42229 RepID=A0A6P5TZB2_PRUAV|nr:putative disease resistance RPP13-like protein 1 [Prunus avium]
MVGALIGEAFISASIQVLCDRITSREFIDLFRQKKLDQPLLMKLKVTLLTLNAVLNDAEEKQIENPAVRKWLGELKHAVFDAEDLLDEINYEALRCKLEGEGQIDNLTNKVWNFLSTSHNHFYQSMNVKIQELLQRLEDFVQLKSALVDARDALQGNLKDKKDLKELKLKWSDEDADDSLKEKDVLDKLQPCVNLEKLTIRSYGGTQFPNWLGDSSFSNIQVMCLKDCSYCWLMPPIGRLPALKKLKIKRMKLVKTIGVEFYGRNEGSPIQPFQSLEKLQFGEMAEWEEWVPSGSGSGGEYGPDFPRLQELILKDCPKLRGSLPLACHMPCLKKLWVTGCGVLHDQRATTTTTSSFKMDSYKSLEELFIGDVYETGLLPFPEILLPNLNCLQHLSLCDCPNLLSFPEDGLPTTLASLEIVNCRRLEFLPHQMMAKLTSLDNLQIYYSCDSMRSFPLGIFPKLTSLYIWECENLESLSVEEGVVENLSHLRTLYITGCPKLVCFPGELPAPNLNDFTVRECQNLQSLPERIHTLTGLQHLGIRGLPNLESFAEDGGLPPNLRVFRLENCERLRPSSVGEYWGLQGLVSLEEFSIGGRGSGDILETLLLEQLLPTTLRTLRIWGLSSMKSLDGKGLGHLTSLQSLHISGCDSIQFLPEEGLPPSLSFLRISQCSALEKRYQNKAGEDWAKISHIPCIRINDEVTI